MGKSKLLGAFAFGLASVMNPAFFAGCGSAGSGARQPEFSFGEADVVALVDVAKAQRYELKTADGSYEIVVDLSQVRGDDSKSGALDPALVRVAHACGNRTFLRSAAACLDVTEVPVAGSITVKRIAPDDIALMDKADAKGVLRVIGTTLTNAEINVKTAEGNITLRSDDAKTFQVRQLVVAGKTLEPSRNGG
jgi:hypothetical protein